MTEQTITWEGAEALRPYLVEIEKLQDTENNPDKGPKHVAELMGSLKRFGQVRPILTDLDDSVTIRAGHHLRRAAQELGWTHIAALPSRFDNYEEALAYVLADNQLTQMGERDKTAQMTLIDLVGEGNLEGTGLTIDDAENLRAFLSAVPEVPQVEPWEGGYSESEEEAAARAAAIGQQQPHKEVVLLLKMEEYEVFGHHIRHLQKQWGTSGIKETFLRAVEEAVVGEDGEWPEGLPSHSDSTSSGDHVSVEGHKVEEVPSPEAEKPIEDAALDAQQLAELEQLSARIDEPEDDGDEPGFLK